MRIILLAALPEEADAVLPGAGTALLDAWPAVRRISAHGHDIVLATTGIGKVNIVSADAVQSTDGSGRRHGCVGRSVFRYEGDPHIEFLAKYARASFRVCPV